MSNGKPSAQAGFSLVETVAAMGILALAAIPLLQITTDANRNAASLETRLLARTVAENEMARAMATRVVLDAGVVTGQETQMGRTFNWVRTTTPAQVGQLQNLRIDVRPAESEQVLASLVSLKYIPKNLTGAPAPADQEGAQ
ncbi:MAG: type II secretion system minor pseudopilin GspI [Pseudomonadota bacterium]|nr:type II secretion system minor pseudopilin GspI [Pseudomonadota bacterium]